MNSTSLAGVNTRSSVGACCITSPLSVVVMAGPGCHSVSSHGPNPAVFSSDLPWCHCFVRFWYSRWEQSLITL